MKGTCKPNFSLIGQKLAKLFIFFHIWLVGWLGRSAWTDYFKMFIVKAPYHNTLPCKNKDASSKCSWDIPFLQFFRRISIGRKFDWSDLRDWFYMNCFLFECLPTKFHRAPIRNAQVMAIWKFRYWQLFGKSGWLMKKWFDCCRVKGTCILNYSLIGLKLPKLSHFFHFWLVGR